VLEIVCKGRRFLIPTELEALGDKKANTLATCLEALLRLKLRPLLPQGAATGARSSSAATGARSSPETWIVHILIGDACATNEAAAKMLLAMFKQEPLGPRVVYFLVVLKCGTHQAALSAKEGVLGRSATSTTPRAKKAAKEVTATAVRLYKYLLADYYEQFVDSVRTWAYANVEALAADISSCQRVMALRQLYTQRVVPNALVVHVHAVTAGITAGNRQPVADAFVLFVVNLLKSDDKPTLNRFFTYRVCIDGMLTMKLIALPQAAFEVQGVRMRTKGQTRLKKVRAFFEDPNADQALRRSSLVLQLTGTVEAEMSKNLTGDEVPTAVRLVRRELHNLVELRLARMLGELHQDPTLDHVAATGALLGTAADLVLRLDDYLRYPLAVCRLCRRWFPTDFLKSCAAFLVEDAANLDFGFGLPFQVIALKHGSDIQCVNWLASSPVQDFLVEVVVYLFTHSLAAERKHNRVKNWLARKLSHIASVSNNLICGEYHKWRLEKSRAIEEAAEELRRARRITQTSLLWKHEQARPKGQLFLRGRDNWRTY